MVEAKVSVLGKGLKGFQVEEPGLCQLRGEQAHTGLIRVCPRTSWFCQRSEKVLAPAQRLWEVEWCVGKETANEVVEEFALDHSPCRTNISLDSDRSSLRRDSQMS